MQELMKKNLEELLSDAANPFFVLVMEKDGNWTAIESNEDGKGKTPKVAVAQLLVKLNGKKD